MSDESTWADETATKGEPPQGVDLRPHLEALAAGGAQLRKAFERAQREGTLGYDLEDRLEDWSQRASGAYWHLGRFDGGKALLTDLETAGVEQKVIRDFQQRIDSVASGLPDKNLGLICWQPCGIRRPKAHSEAQAARQRLKPPVVKAKTLLRGSNGTKDCLVQTERSIKPRVRARPR